MFAVHHYRRLFVATSLAITTACGQPDSVVSPTHSGYPLDDRPRSGVPGLAELLVAIQEATEPFRDERLARAAGYAPVASDCERSADGSLGLRYLNAALVGLMSGSEPTTGTDGVIDLLRPEVLLYELPEVGAPKLVGVVYIVYHDAWHAEHPEPPTFFGMPFSERVGADGRGSAEYYEFTLWVWRFNPVGMFSPANPLLTC